MPKIILTLVTACLAVFLTGRCFSESVFVELSDVPEDGFIVCPLDMTPAYKWLGNNGVGPVEFYYEDRKLDATFVPNLSDTPLRTTFVAVLPDDVPRGKPCRLRLENRDEVSARNSSRERSSPAANGVTGEGGTELAPPVTPFGHFVTSLRSRLLFHSNLPSSIAFDNETTLDSHRWHDRLHDPDTGSWGIADNDDATVELLADLPFVKVIRTTAAFKQGENVPPSQPKAVYDWFIFPQRELIYVIVTAQQDQPVEWKEKHFLELHIPDGSFGKWFGDDKSGTFTGTKQSQTFQRFAGFLDDANNVIATIVPGTVVYDGLNDFGPYLMPRGNDAWQAWSDTKHRMTAWFWIGNSPEPTKSLQAAYECVRAMPRAEIVIPELEQPAADWKTAALNDLFLSGKIASKEELERLRNAEALPKNWFVHETDDLGMILEITDDQEKGMGIRLLSLVDKRTNTILSARVSVPLFTAEVLDKETGKTVTLTSDSGWESVTRNESCIFLSNPKVLPESEKLTMYLRLFYESNRYPPSQEGFRWVWHYWQKVDRYEFRKVSCGQIALRNLGPTMKAFYPHVSGVVTENPVGKELRWQGTYPSGWCSMPFTAVYDETKNVGLYVSAYDTGGSVKDIRLNADSASDSLTIRFEQPQPLGFSRKSLDTGWIWRSLEGDWYDAANIYRNEVRKSAEWYPREEYAPDGRTDVMYWMKVKRFGPDGRTDTPQWMKELCVWALCSDSPDKMPETMRKFTDALGVPTAVHWYNWHQIPFDNDYPHFFPAKDGFAEAVAEIQKNGDCFVMPYINGHLWDTRDKGMEDFLFTSDALAAAAKKEDGTPYIETYGSKEADGSPVALAAMCPATDVWKAKVGENVLRLINECGVAGVYIDQVAAAQPNLCFDPTHGHPPASGDWWCREYWDMFGKIRSELPADRMLTTECNAEPYVNIFDGYLTWHFQYQDQVPAFAAVYGGALQMFGRAYRGGASQVLADRMKAAQQLVYGEQIGWLDPRIVDDPVRFPFFKEIVHTRYKYRDYFYKGEMIRPPKLLDANPTVTADWQWSGEWPITTEAVQTGAWRKTDNTGKTTSAVFFFVNVSDEPITSRVEVRFDEIGLQSSAFDEPLTFEPGVPVVVEVGSTKSLK